MKDIKLEILNLDLEYFNQLYALIIIDSITSIEKSDFSKFEFEQLLNIKKFDLKLFIIYNDFLKGKYDYEKLNFKINEYIKSFNNLYRKCLEISNKHITYIKHCSFYVYEKTFESRYNELVNNNPDLDIYYFIETEYNDITFDFDNFNKFDRENLIALKIAQNKKKKFLESKAFELGYKFYDELGFDDFIEKFEKTEHQFKLIPNEINQNDDELLYKLTNVQKIIILNQLDFFESLKKNNPHINPKRISDIVSSLIDCNKDSIRSNINELLSSNSIKQKNHPYYSKQTLNKVKDIFKSWGLLFKTK